MVLILLLMMLLMLLLLLMVLILVALDDGFNDGTDTAADDVLMVIHYFFWIPIMRTSCAIPHPSNKQNLHKVRIIR